MLEGADTERILGILEDLKKHLASGSPNISEADAGQLVQYCSVVGIEWAVVTNARQWWLYHQFAQVRLQEKLVFTLDLVAWNTPAEFQALTALLTLVSKTAFLHSDGPGA